MTTLVVGLRRSRWRRRSRTPTQNATVFPDPVAEEATMSLPIIAIGMHSRWIGVGLVRLSEPRARRSWRERLALGIVPNEMALLEEAVVLLWAVK